MLIYIILREGWIILYNEMDLKKYNSVIFFCIYKYNMYMIKGALLRLQCQIFLILCLLILSQFLEASKLHC